jgi:hypothetical protein
VFFVGPVSEEFSEHVLGLETIGAARLLKGTLQALDWPIRNGVSGVVEHLSDDFPSNPRIRAALDFDEHRDSILIEEEVINPPSAPACIAVQTHSRLALHEEPAPTWICCLVTDQDDRILNDQLLQNRLGVVRLLPHLDEFTIFADEEDSWTHVTLTGNSSICRASV